ncbi:hypothetical protein AMTRI_Chr09g42260 [Amborella trichopoda]
MLGPISLGSKISLLYCLPPSCKREIIPSTLSLSHLKLGSFLLFPLHAEERSYLQIIPSRAWASVINWLIPVLICVGKRIFLYLCYCAGHSLLNPKSYIMFQFLNLINEVCIFLLIFGCKNLHA